VSVPGFLIMQFVVPHIAWYAYSKWLQSLPLPHFLENWCASYNDLR